MSTNTKLSRGGWTLAGVALAMTLAASGAALTLTSTATATRAPAAASHNAGGQWLAAARSALVRYLRHAQAPAAIAPAPSAGRGPLLSASTTFSYNWSGYADTSSTKGAFAAVAGKWTTPSVKCTAEDTITSEWVGIDGWGDKTVEQDGTLDWCFEGQATYFTWYEMYPAATVEVGRSLHPGDQIAASVTRKGTSYTLSVTDSTHTTDSFTKKASLRGVHLPGHQRRMGRRAAGFPDDRVRAARLVRQVEPNGRHGDVGSQGRDDLHVPCARHRHGRQHRQLPAVHDIGADDGQGLHHHLGQQLLIPGDGVHPGPAPAASETPGARAPRGRRAQRSVGATARQRCPREAGRTCGRRRAYWGLVPVVDYGRDDIAHRYAGARALGDDVLARWGAAVTPVLPRRAPLRVLDVGAGTGIFACAWPQWRRCDVVALEPSAAMRGEMVHGGVPPAVRVVGGCGEELPLRSTSVDVAWLSTVVHHLTDLARCASELRRVLAADGVVLVRGLFCDRGEPPAVCASCRGRNAALSAFPSTATASDALARHGLRLLGAADVEDAGPSTVGEAAARLRRLRHIDSLLGHFTDAEVTKASPPWSAALDEPSPASRLSLLVLRDLTRSPLWMSRHPTRAGRIGTG